MKRALVPLVVLVLAASAGLLAACRKEAPRASSSPGPAGTASTPAAPGAGSRPSEAATARPSDAVNLAAPEFGGHIESVTSEVDHEDRSAVHLIDRGLPEESTWSAAGPAPQEAVVGFLNGQAAHVSAVLFDPNTHTSARWAKDVEVWASMQGPSTGFVKVAATTLAREDAEQALRFAPVPARFVKIRVLSQYLGDDYQVGLGKIKILGVLDGGAAGAAAAPSPVPPPAPPAEAELAAGAACDTGPPAPPPAPVHGSSAKVLVLSRRDSMYPPISYKAKNPADDPSGALFSRFAFTRVAPGAATVALLDPSQGFDTVVLSQVCDSKTSLPDSFKRALVAWVGQGHKLIVLDADLCDAARQPDYSFLPYKFATSNPGRHGAESKKLTLIEENTLGRSSAGDPAFLDLDAWTQGHNELGDSNTVTKYDGHWCGALVTRNVLNVNGFVESYAHYGRGLILYDGFDIDQAASPTYRTLLAHELAQPFDPDGLACTARLADFVLTTEPALRTREMAAGRTYRYPVTLLSNQGYKGTVHLTAAVSPADAAVTASLSQGSVDLVDSSDVQLTVTSTGAARIVPRTIAVRGTDAGGQASLLCLRLGEKTTGSLRVATDFPHPAHAAKNLEIILDLSGSMKLPLGTSTRIATARRVLHDVVAKLPDDVNVGLRVYGHRYGSRQKETCTDSELVLPIQKLDRDRLLRIVDTKQPRGETPLVYSVLQTAGDLKAVGGGSVILITDGEESCHGDTAAAARELKAAGVDIKLQILGFTLTGQRVQQELSQFAEATGGRYFGAEDGEALGRALLMAAVDKMGFVVLDASGRTVGQGSTDSGGVELPPGQYTVAIKTATGELRAEHVAVPARGDAVVTVVIANGRFQLRQ